MIEISTKDYIRPSKRKGFQLIKKYIGFHKCIKCKQYSKRGRKNQPTKNEKKLGIGVEFICEKCILNKKI